jgi:uncharacterized membrane protein YciS (DUF1049 family)
MDILLLIAIPFAAGIVGGLVMAEAFELEPREQRRRARRARRQARKNNRKNVNFTIDFF